MRTAIAWLLLVLLVVLTIGCWSGRRGTGTNIGVGSGSADGPWNQGGTSPALTAHPAP
jgi:hypothetical protein